MAKRTAEDVIRLAKENNVAFVRLQFTDILGIVKNVAIPVRQLEKALNNEMMFDGSSIEGFTRIEESDMNLRPDPDTWATFPWRPEYEATARLICDVYNCHGEPFEGDPRYVLRRVINQAADMGYEVNVGPECEFFLFHLSDTGEPTTRTHDKAGYFDLGPIDKGEDARRDIVLALEEMGFEIEASHHEVAAGQHEIDLKYSDALTTADRVATLKFVTKTVASLHNLHATFMPKPIFGACGSGMHTHISLFKDGKNVFYDPDGQYQLSDIARYFIGGVLLHCPAITAITNPLVNSYKRLVPGYEAPVYIAWSAQNRSSLIRVPASRKQGTRIELRSPDPSCNPYLALAVIIGAGLRGIRDEIEPPASVDKNIYDMSSRERKAYGIRRLPATLEEAVDELAKDELIAEILGSHVLSHFIKAKRIESEVYRMQVTDWEVKQYLWMF